MLLKVNTGKKSSWMGLVLKLHDIVDLVWNCEQVTELLTYRGCVSTMYKTQSSSIDKYILIAT